MEQHDIIKILLFGPAGVGKKSLVEKYFSSLLDYPSKLTIGVGFLAKKVEFDGNNVILQIWDFGEEKKFRSLVPMYCRGALGALLIFDITKSLAIDHLHEGIHFIREKAGDLPLMLIGNKLDEANFHELTQEKGNEIAKEFNLVDYIEISTKTGENVEKMFVTLVDFIMTK
ncbi:MAG: Rab family GTPase [Promethearchaeota archaeon]